VHVVLRIRSLAAGAASGVAIALFLAWPGFAGASPGEPSELQEPAELVLPFERQLRRLPPRLRSQLRGQWARHAPLVESRLLQALERVPAQWRPHVAAWRTLATSRDGRRGGLGLAGGLFAVLVVLRLARRPGHVVVAIEYPAELRGTFSVQVARRKKALLPARELPGASASPLLHQMVSRETQFRDLRPGRYFVVATGDLQDPSSGECVKRPSLTQALVVRSRRTARAEFDLRPRGAAVTVRVIWEGHDASEVSVAVFGRSDTLRYARGGTARLELPVGEHRVVVGSEDRVAEIDVSVRGPQSLSLEVDLAGAENVVFRGCPPAVKPYLQGDLSAAARALAREGQEALANLLKARLCEAGGEPERAAALYQEAGDATNAIRLLEQVQPDQSRFADACEMLAEVFSAEGRFEEAAVRLEAALEEQNPNLDPLALRSRLAAVLEQCEQLPRALELLEQLRVEEPEYPNVTTRIEALRKRLSSEGHTSPGLEGAPHIAPAEGRYELLEQIGAGGMGVVFRALDRRLGREVALKKLPENLRDHPTAIELFLREARAAAALNHPNIVTLYDADDQDGSFFITMELLAGSSLGALLRRHGRLAARDAGLMGRQVAVGLAYAHERRIVHRDIKPANLFYTTERTVKIMDFGLAKMIEEVRRTATVVGGTPYYMAPEQSSGDPVGTPADLYALGVTLYELVTGRVPFRDGDVAQAHREATPIDPRTLVAELPDLFTTLILELLAKDPDARPSAAEAGERLERV
jgi:tetratricopeptide (TPR) repeat protein